MKLLGQELLVLSCCLSTAKRSGRKGNISILFSVSPFFFFGAVT